MKNHIWKIIFGVFVVLMGASFWYASYVGEKANEGVVITDHIQGNKDAKVRLTEYADFQCPACSQFHPVVKDVLEKYGEDIAFEFKHFPLISLHPYAVPAAKAAESAGQQDKFFEMYDKLFENQAVWSKSPTPQVLFMQYAQEIGLDMDLYKQHMRSSLLQEQIEKQFDEARKLGLTGTPSFYINGKRMEYKTMGDFIASIESELGIGTSTPETTNDSGVEFGLPEVQ